MRLPQQKCERTPPPFPTTLFARRDRFCNERSIGKCVIVISSYHTRNRFAALWCDRSHCAVSARSVMLNAEIAPFRRGNLRGLLCHALHIRFIFPNQRRRPDRRRAAMHARECV